MGIGDRDGDKIFENQGTGTGMETANVGRDPGYIDSPANSGLNGLCNLSVFYNLSFLSSVTRRDERFDQTGDRNAHRTAYDLRPGFKSLRPPDPRDFPRTPASRRPPQEGAPAQVAE